ncbi:MAG TPA: MFS transporter [Streptosporangiaceae bacterium]|jgi:MFS family permease
MSRSSAGRYRDALRHRDFTLMLTASLIDRVGSWAYNVVLIVYVYQRTGSVSWVAATTAAGWIPRIVFSAYAGVLADRFERTRTLLVSTVLGLILMAVLALIMAADGPLPLILLLAVATSAVGTVYLPVSGALTPETVPEGDLAAANGLFGVLENLVVIAGPGIGGLLLLAGRPVWGILFNVATYAAAAVLVSRMRVRSAGQGVSPAPARRPGTVRQIADGVSALRRHPRAGLLVAFCALGTAVYGASTVLYIPMSQRFGTGADGYSYLLAAAAIGGVLGAVLAGKLGASVPLPPVIGGGMLALALPFAATIFTTSPAAGFVLQVISGGGMAVIDVLALVGLQRDLPRDVLSRVLGILEATGIGAAMASSFAVAGLLRWGGLADALLIVGLGFSAVAVAGLWPLARVQVRVVPAVPAARAPLPA